MQQRWVSLRQNSFLLGRPGLLWLGLLGIFCLVAPASRAEEPSAKFLEKLKQANYYDVAAIYIEQLQANPSLSADAKMALNYEQGDILWKQGLNTRDAKQRDEIIAKAQAKLAEFLKAAPKHQNASDALLSLARMSYIRGQSLRKMAEKMTPDKREPHMAAARAQLAEAKKYLEESEKQAIEYLTPLNAKLKKAEELTKEEEDIKDKFFPALLEVRLLLGESLYENALTYPPKSKEYKDGLTASNKEFGEAYDKYAKEGLKKRFGAGFKARTNQARNAILLGNFRDGKDYAWQVFTTENIPASIFKPAQRIAYEAMLHEGKFEESFKDVEAGMKDLPRISSPLDAEIFYFAAALAEKASGVAKTPNDKNRIKALAIKYTRDLLRFKMAFEFYAETREIAKRLEIKNTASGGQSFAELNLEAKQVYGQYTEAYETWQNFQGPDEQRKELLEQRDAMNEATFDAVTAALAAAPRTIPPDDLAFLRYFLCTYHSQKNNALEAIVFGEATALGGANNRFALKAASVTLRSLQMARKNLLDLKKQGKAVSDSELSDLGKHLARAANYLITTWSTSPEADGARSILAQSELEDGRLEEAAKVIAKMDPKGPIAASAQLTLGITAAQKYYNGMYGREKTDGTEKAAQAFKPYVASALKPALLSMQANDKTGLDSRGVLGAYFFLLIKLREDIADPDVLKVIDTPKTGIMAMLKADSDEIPDEIHFSLGQIVFQAFLLSGKPDAAIAMVDQLEAQAVKDKDEELKKRVNAIIIGAGKELEKQINDVRAKDPAKAAKLAGTFAGLLDKLSQKSASLDFPNLYVISESYVNLAESDPTNKAELLKKAEGIYNAILERAAKDPEFVKSANSLQIIRVKQIGVIRARGDYKDAYAKLKTMLKPKPAVLAAQIEAANVLQQWAKAEPAGSKQKLTLLGKALVGEYDETDMNLQVIWGLRKIRQVLEVQKTFATDQNLRNMYFDACLSYAQVRYAMGLEYKDGDEKRLKSFASAKDIIAATYERDPTFGGPTMKAEFEKLLKTLQSALKTAPNGFQEIIENNKKLEAAATPVSATMQ
jgi:hypothetical protein